MCATLAVKEARFAQGAIAVGQQHEPRYKSMPENSKISAGLGNASTHRVQTWARTEKSEGVGEYKPRDRAEAGESEKEEAETV